jgi:chorismate mutase
MVDPELAALREAIDALDGSVLALLKQRIELVLRVGEWKRRHDRPVYDPERERRMLDRLTSAATPPLDPAAVRRIFERIIDESRRAEQHHTGRR